MKEKERLDNIARASAWNKANKERRREIKRRSFQRNRAKELESRKRWHASNKARMAIVQRLWVQNNPEKVIETAARRRWLKKVGAEKIAQEDLRLLLEKQNGCCAYCGGRLDGGKHLDHIVPLTRGGNHTLSNLAWACPPCNLHKSNKLLSEWLT